MSNFREMLSKGSAMTPAKDSNLKYEYVRYSFEARDLEISNMCEISKFGDFMSTLRNFAKSFMLMFPRKLNISRNNLY